MDDNQATAAGLNPDYVAPRVAPDTEREHQLYQQGRRDGYREGQDDLMFGLSKGFKWAEDRLATFRASMLADEQNNSARATPPNTGE